MSELLPDSKALHAQVSPLTMSLQLTGITNTVVFDPLASSALRWYTRAYTSVEILGPFKLSLNTPAAQDKAYSISVAAIPDTYRTDHPRGAQEVGDIPGAAYVELTGLSPPTATELGWHHTIEWKVQPLIRTTGAPHLPVLVVYYSTLGTNAASTATLRFHCQVRVSGSNFPKTWGTP
jgi:hypothetical protein